MTLHLVLLLFLLVVSFIIVLPSTAAFAQIESTTTTTTPTAFMDDTGFTMTLPPGWIGNDYDNKGASAINTENKLGYTKLATFCPQEDAVPKLGSETLTCNMGGASNWITVFRYKDLASKPEFAPIVQSGRPITANDVYLYHLEEIRNYNKAANPNNPQLWEPIIYEEHTQENVPITRNAAGSTGLELPPLNGKIAMTLDTGYSLFFIDDSTGYAYRVTSNGFHIGYWRGQDACVLECSAIVSSIPTTGINPNIQAGTPNPLLQYNPPTTLDYFDPGAVILIPTETLAAQASSSSEDPTGLGLFGQ